jgi:hypothetical protein
MGATGLGQICPAWHRIGPRVVLSRPWGTNHALIIGINDHEKWPRMNRITLFYFLEFLCRLKGNIVGFSIAFL